MMHKNLKDGNIVFRFSLDSRPDEKIVAHIRSNRERAAQHRKLQRDLKRREEMAAAMDNKTDRELMLAAMGKEV